MNTSYKLEEPVADKFTPISGSWSYLRPTGADKFEIEMEIALDLERKHGGQFGVEIFHANGRAIMGDCPANGTLLAIPG